MKGRQILTENHSHNVEYSDAIYKIKHYLYVEQKFKSEGIKDATIIMKYANDRYSENILIAESRKWLLDKIKEGTFTDMKRRFEKGDFNPHKKKEHPVIHPSLKDNYTIDQKIKIRSEMQNIRRYFLDNKRNLNGVSNLDACKTWALEVLGESVHDYKAYIMDKIECGYLSGEIKKKEEHKSKLTPERATYDKLPKKTKKKKVRRESKASYKQFLATPYWWDVRSKVIERDGGKCQHCGSTNLLRVHHLTYDHHWIEHLHLEDLITLCEPCHKIEHKRK